MERKRLRSLTFSHYFDPEEISYEDIIDPDPEGLLKITNITERDEGVFYCYAITEGKTVLEYQGYFASGLGSLLLGGSSNIRFKVNVQDETPEKPSSLRLLKTYRGLHKLVFYPDPTIYFDNCKEENFIIRQVGLGGRDGLFIIMPVANFQFEERGREFGQD